MLELPNHEDMVLSKSEVSQILREKEDVYSWYMPKWAGVETYYDADEEEYYGLPRWEKVNEDGTVEYVNKYNQATFQIVGSASPLFSGGINTGLRWKNFTLTMNGSYMVGNKIYNKNIQQQIGANVMYQSEGMHAQVGASLMPRNIVNETKQAEDFVYEGMTPISRTVPASMKTIMDCISGLNASTVFSITVEVIMGMSALGALFFTVITASAASFSSSREKAERPSAGILVS